MKQTRWQRWQSQSEGPNSNDKNRKFPSWNANGAMLWKIEQFYRKLVQCAVWWHNSVVLNVPNRYEYFLPQPFNAGMAFLFIFSNILKYIDICLLYIVRYVVVDTWFFVRTYRFDGTWWGKNGSKTFYHGQRFEKDRMK